MKDMSLGALFVVPYITLIFLKDKFRMECPTVLEGTFNSAALILKVITPIIKLDTTLPSSGLILGP